MDDGNLDFSNQEVFPGSNVGEQLPSSCSMDSFFDELLNDTHQHACTHTHTCNPPGPELSHTHTCFHVHTKILSAPADETAESDEKSSSKKRPCGNREAVRKYREKKKAQTASLEDEVIQLRAINEQLTKRLQGQAALEAEVARLRCLLVDIRGRIEGEIGSFPYQKPSKGGVDFVSSMTQLNTLGGAHASNSCDLRCDDQIYCLHPGMQGRGEGENGELNGQGFGVCEIGNVQCKGSSSSGSKEDLGCGRGHVLPTGCSSNTKKRKGPLIMEDHIHDDVHSKPRVKATLRLGSEIFSVNAGTGVLSKQLVAMKEESMGILKDFITKHNVPNDVPDEAIESLSEDETEAPKNPPKKSKKQK